MPCWWKRFPARYDHEMVALNQAGYRFTVDEAAKADGQLVLDVEFPSQGGLIRLRVHFPDTYPYFPFAVVAPDLSLPRHQDPFSKLLCLIGGGSSENWSSEDTVASILASQMPRLLAVTAPEAEVPPGEEEQDAEPFTAHAKVEPDTYIGVGDWHIPPEANRGTLTVGLHCAWPLRGTVLAVSDSRGNLCAEADEKILSRYRNAPRLAGRWVRLAAKPGTDDPTQLLELLAAHDPVLGRPAWQRIFENPEGTISFDLAAAVFPDELAWREQADNWLFIVRRREQRWTKRRGNRASSTVAMTHLVRTGRDSPLALRQRVPELRPLQDKKVAVFGLGSLGSVSAVEFARAGVGQLWILDRDIVEVGNSVRWALGHASAGLPKAAALLDFLTQHYPYTVVRALHFALGSASISPRHPHSLSELQVLDRALEGADLVYDATAERSANHLLSALCEERGIPYTWITTTPGAWGGIVGRVLPGKTGCWCCFKRHQNDGTVRSPNYSQTEGVQPVGCLHPTFTGAAVDINQIALAGVRLAISTLCQGAAGAYPAFDWDVASINLRADTGAPIPPDWKIYPLQPHPDCDHE